MPNGRKKTDEAFRTSVRQAFNSLAERLKREHKNPASEISGALGVSKQTAYQYLKGTAIPNSDRLAKAVHTWRLRLDYQEHRFYADAFGPASQEPPPDAVRQIELEDLIEAPAEIPLPGTDCRLRISVKQETLELVIKLKQSA